MEDAQIGEDHEYEGQTDSKTDDGDGVGWSCLPLDCTDGFAPNIGIAGPAEYWW